MSSASARSRLVLAAAAILSLAGCQVRPLYAPSPTAMAPQFELPAIAIDQSVSREEQVFRNELTFALRGRGGDSVPARYHLIYRLQIRESEVAVERRTGTPNAYQLSGSVSLLIEDVGTGRPVVGATVTAIDSYDRSTQNYANVRARRDAEDRLLATLAQLAHARIAAYFATR